MGITIHYSGRINNLVQLPELVGQLKAACREVGWPFQEINERVVGVVEIPHYESGSVTTDRQPLDDRWQGLAIAPPGCDTLYLAFSRAGQLVVYHAWFDSPPGTYWLQETMYCKTQFSTPDIHIAVCNILRIVQPYMAEWKVCDEGNYWESGDCAELEEQMKTTADFINHIASETGRAELEEISGEEIKGNIEIGKWIVEIPPVWREHWGESAQEN